MEIYYSQINLKNFTKVFNSLKTELTKASPCKFYNKKYYF